MSEVLERGLSVLHRDDRVAFQVEQPNQRGPSLIVILDDQKRQARTWVPNHE
jgi:hypothetical protein